MASRSSSTGKMPWAVVDTAMTLTIANPGLKTATQLDINGNAGRKLEVVTEGQSLQIDPSQGLRCTSCSEHGERLESSSADCLGSEASGRTQRKASNAR